MAPYLISFLLFFLPLIFFPLGASQFELPKIWVFTISTFIIFCWVIFSKEVYFVKTNHEKFIMLLVSIVILTAYDLLFLQTPFSFFGDPTRFQGILLLWFLLAFSLCSSLVRIKKLPYYWYAIILLILLLASTLIGNQTGRAVATIGEPNALAATIIFLWPFLYFAEKMKRKFILPAKVISILCAVGVIVLSGSRSGLIAFLIQILFLILLRLFKFSLKSSLIITICMMFVSYIFPLISNIQYENRADIWKTAVIAGVNPPLFGTGFGNMEIVLNKTTHTLHNSLIGYSIDSAHNIFLDWWVQGGIVGLGIFVFLIYLTFKNFYLKGKEHKLLLLLGLITALSFNPASVVSLVALWWLIGSSFAKLDDK